MIEGRSEHNRGTTTFSKVAGEENPALEKPPWNKIDAALRQNLLWWRTHRLRVQFKNQEMSLEYGYIDTREKDSERGNVVVINITGAWGRGPECDGEVVAYAYVMGDDGLEMVNLSLPGHGRSSPLPDGWEQKENYNPFDDCAKLVAQYIKENYKNDDNLEPGEDKKQRKVVINAWSMGGITALKLAAEFPELVDAVVLMDTPVYPMNFRQLVKRFIKYGLRQTGVEPEQGEPISFKRLGIGIFYERLKKAGYEIQRKDGGMPLKLVKTSAKSMCEQNLEEDGTLDLVAEHKIPILLLHGQNDKVVPRKFMVNMDKYLRERDGDITRMKISRAGHALPAERPKHVGKTIRLWLAKKEIIPPLGDLTKVE